MKKRLKKNMLWLFLLPSLLGMAVFYCIPFLFSIYYAVIDNMASKKIVGLSNILATLQSETFQKAAGNTLLFILICVSANMLLSFFLASALRKLRRMGNIARLILMMPLFIPSGAMVYIWKTFFDANGLLNSILFRLGIPIKTWMESAWSLAIIVIIFLWKNIGYNIVLFTVGLGLIPKDYYDLAVMEGAGGWQKFRHVTLIYLLPTGFLVLLMSVINSFKAFKEIYLLVGNYPNDAIYMLQHYLNNQFFALNMQSLTSASLIMTAVIVLFIFGLFKAQKRLSETFN